LPGVPLFLEIGCGTGHVLSGVARAYPGTKIYGSELFPAGLAFAAEREPAADFMQMDARHIPFIDEFDVIGAFDVLEHIKEDEQVLAQMYSALKPGGSWYLRFRSIRGYGVPLTIIPVMSAVTLPKNFTQKSGPRVTKSCAAHPLCQVYFL